MEISTLGWLGLILILVTTTFGFYWFLLITVGIFVFLFGFFALLYVTQGDIEKCYSNCAGNPLICDLDVSGGIQDVITQMQSPKKVQKTDNRVTGSDLIDSSLQEILGYIIRDYVSPWYSLISRDTEFTNVTVKKTAQTFAINISNRIKDVDWIPYLTQRMVDDAATHLRLFKQSRAKIKPSKPKSNKNSPMREKSPKKLTHKRNKSEPESTWYLKTSNNDLKKDDRSVDTKINSKNSLEDNFFILECQMENNLICRDSVCMDTEKEKEFLGEIVELLLYILLPDEDFQCKPLRYALREIFSNAVVLPLLTVLSDPDYINQTIIWLCLREKSLPSEIFLTTLRLTYSCDELKSTKDLVSREIQLLRSRDSGGESDLAIKQQLSSLFYVMKLIDSRLAKLDDFEDPDNPNPIDDFQLESIKKIDLTLDQILKNNIALSYFIDYVSSHGKQAELFFYLNVEGWKVSVEQQLSDLHLNKIKGVSENAGAVYENIRSTASSIYDQYLSEKSEQNVQLKPSLTQSLYFKLRNLNETPSELWFDEVRQAVYVKMETHEDFLPAFRRSKVYIKLLQELDLVQQNVAEEDNVSLSSVENLELSSDTKATIDSISIPSKSGDFLQVKSAQRNGKHSRSFSDVAVLSSKLEDDKDSNQSDDEVIDGKLDEKVLRSSEYSLAVDIIETGIVCEKGKTFGIYAIKVSRQYDTGFLEEWHIYRRYSDFHDLYTKVKEKFPDLAKIPFPGKKTFHNMDRAVLERRMKMLGIYMNELCQPNIANSHHGLKSLLMTFLEQGDYDRATGGPISNTIDTIVNPLKSGMKTIKNMPEQLFNTVDEVVGGLSKVFNTKTVKVPETCKVGASIEESDDNIPFRIMLLLMDEVFDLKSRNQWLRRRIVTILRQIVRTMFGDIVNRKILDYVSVATSPKNVAHYLHVFKQSFWPNGVKCDRKVERDVDTKNRTRVAAKVALLSCLSDELKHIIGSETTRRGLLTVFELFQRPILNRRLLYVMLEGILCTLFPEKDMTKIFQKLHSKSKLISQSKPESHVR